MLSRKRKVQNRLSGEELIQTLTPKRLFGSAFLAAYLGSLIFQISFGEAVFPDQDSDYSGPDEALRKKIRLTQPGG